LRGGLGVTPVSGAGGDGLEGEPVRQRRTLQRRTTPSLDQNPIV